MTPLDVWCLPRPLESIKSKLVSPVCFRHVYMDDQRFRIGPTNRTFINAHIYATTFRRYASTCIEASARRNSKVIFKLILTAKDKFGKGSEVSENGKRHVDDAIEIPSAKESRSNKETGKKAVPNKALAKKPRANKELLAELEEAYDRYIAKIDAEIERRDAAVLRDMVWIWWRKHLNFLLRNPHSTSSSYVCLLVHALVQHAPHGRLDPWCFSTGRTANILNKVTSDGPQLCSWM